MNILDYSQLLLFLLLLFALSYPMGLYIEKVMKGERTALYFIFRPIERVIYFICRIQEKETSSWKKYVLDVILFSIISCAVSYFILRYQSILPLNPQNFSALSTPLSFNTAISFLTNTNWQAYGGESSLSYFSQMMALTPHNFMSAAMGLAILIAIIRGLVGENLKGLGNFWIDITRATLYILLPVSFIVALILISQGVIQNFLPYIQVKTLEGVKQIIAQGPVASQVAIKMLGVNGGGFFNANAAHPYENPTAISNFIQMISIFLFPSALVFTFGKMAKNMKHAISIWFIMAILFVTGTLILSHFEYFGNPNFISQLHLSSAFNMEGKETRFGIFASSLFANVTTSASCGAVNAAHGSLTPIGGFVSLVNMLLNEVIFGGVGSGLYGMILFIILAVFISGLMVGRTPEYLGKKIEAHEVKLAMIPLIGVSAGLLILLAIASISALGYSSTGNPNAHGFSEMLYAYTSTAQNNGSAFASLNANTNFWNYSTSFTMLLGRYLHIIPLLAIAGHMGTKRIRSTSEESAFPIHGITFIILVICVIIIIGALTYIPALALGPMLEHLQMLGGQFFSMGAH